jgi:hypothetical protein
MLLPDGLHVEDDKSRDTQDKDGQQPTQQQQVQAGTLTTSRRPWMYDYGA